MNGEFLGSAAVTVLLAITGLRRVAALLVRLDAALSDSRGYSDSRAR